MQVFLQKILYLSVIILLLIGFTLFAFAIMQIIRAIIKLGKAIYYKKIANANQIDEGFKKHVLKQEDDYKSFEKNLDKKLRNGI